YGFTVYFVNMDSLMQFFIIGNKKTHGITPFVGANAEPGPWSKNVLESLIGIFDTHTAGTPVHNLCSVGSQSIVFHFKKDHAIDPFHGKHDRTALLLGSDPVLNRILHQRLKDHRRNLHIKTGKINLLDKFQPVAETHLLYPDIVVNEIELMDKFHHLIAMGVEGIPENIRQLGNNLPRLLLAGADQGIY